MTRRPDLPELGVFRTTRFKRDWKHCAKTPDIDLRELADVVRRLARRESLDPRLHDHALAGRWKDHRECHIRPDWLLIYLVVDDELRLVRTGTHAELFGS